VDVCGAISMYSLSLASERPGLVGLENNYKDDPTSVFCSTALICPNLFLRSRNGLSAIIADSVVEKILMELL
jgi:hypothetical protein